MTHAHAQVARVQCMQVVGEVCWRSVPVLPPLLTVAAVSPTSLPGGRFVRSSLATKDQSVIRRRPVSSRSNIVSVGRF